MLSWNESSIQSTLPHSFSVWSSDEKETKIIVAVNFRLSCFHLDSDFIVYSLKKTASTAEVTEKIEIVTKICNQLHGSG